MTPVCLVLCCLFNPETFVHRTRQVGNSKRANDHLNKFKSCNQ